MAEKEYIDREALMFHIAGVKSHIKGDSDWQIGYRDALQAVGEVVQTFPTADVVEVRHGKWISASQKKGVNIGVKCSLCGARIKYSEFFNGNHNYCHKCGAKMDGKGEG